MTYWDMLNQRKFLFGGFLKHVPLRQFGDLYPVIAQLQKAHSFILVVGASERPPICVASVSRPEFIIESAVDSADTLPRFNLSLLSVFSAYCMAGGSKRGISHDFMTRTSKLSSNVFGSVRFARSRLRS